MLDSVNYWMRGHSDFTNKDYVIGGNYETIDGEGGIYKVVMKLAVKLEKPSDFGIFKCVAKNALGSSEETIKVLREFVLNFLSYAAWMETWHWEAFKNHIQKHLLPRYAW